MSEKGPRRPPWCQDPRCTPDVNTLLHLNDDHAGDSAWCCGRVPEPLVTIRHGRTHRNDGHWCFRSPVRGVVMLEINEGDLDLITRTAVKALRARGRDQFNARWYGFDTEQSGR